MPSHVGVLAHIHRAARQVRSSWHSRHEYTLVRFTMYCCGTDRVAINSLASCSSRRMRGEGDGLEFSRGVLESTGLVSVG